MRNLSAATEAALLAGTIVPRDFMRIVARNRTTGAPVEECFWSDVGNISAQVIDPETGNAVTYNFFGAGDLIGVDAIPLVSNLTVQTIGVQFSQIADTVNELVRVHDLSQARVEIFRGLYDPATMKIVDPAEPRFVGFIDGASIETPAEGEFGRVGVKCKSHTAELSRNNPDTRSDESQQERHPGDTFFQDVGNTAEENIFCGKVTGLVGSQ